MNNEFHLNPVFDSLKPSSTLYINETVNELWAQGEQVFHMGFGESRFDVHPKLQKALVENAHQKSYLPARGLPVLRESVANYYTEKLAIDFAAPQVLIGPGSKALIYALQMILDADLFLPSPSWVSYAPQAELLGNRCFYVPSKAEDNYKLDLAELDRLVQASDARSKVLIINSPNNPTGESFSDHFLQELADYCRSNQIIVLSDEIYFELNFDSDRHCSIAKYYPERTVVLGGLSKHMSLGGWRIGVALMPDNDWGKALSQKTVVFASETWSSVAAPIQYAAVPAYSLDPEIEQYVEDCCAIHAVRTRFIRQKLMDMGVRCSGGKGAFYIAANFDKYRTELAGLGVHTSEQLARHLLDEFRIATLPGVDFGLPSEMLTLRLATSYLDMEQPADASRIVALYTSGIKDQALMSESHHPSTHQCLQIFQRFMLSLK